MIRHPLRECALAIAIGAASLGATAAQAQEFPNRAIRMLVGFPAGGPSDVPARLIAEHMREALGQAVVVENKTGAAGTIAVKELLAQPRDGHTLLLCSYLEPTNTLLYKSVAYKIEDIAPISLVTKAYYAFTVPTSLPVNSMQEFIAHAKARPGQLNYGRVGAGSVTELLAKQLEKVAGISMVGVPFRGTGPALQEVAGGRIEFMVGPLSLSLPLHEGNQVKILGLTSPERLAAAPKLPTLVEQGVPITNYGWWGVCGASGIPAPVIDRINKVVVAAVTGPNYRSVMEKSGTIPTASTPAEMAAIMAETVRDFGGLIKDLGIAQIEQ
jgi:tripartite-type tricarboxylate transporter receptor subunit TctC